MKYIDPKELAHRVGNGFISHDGYVDGDFVDVYVDNGLNIWTNKGDNDLMRLMNEVVRIIQSVPEVDAEIVKHGHWVIYESGAGIWCSRCKHRCRYMDIDNAYCPNCGAKMDEEESE